MFSPLLPLNSFRVPECELHLLERLTVITSGLFNCVIPAGSHTWSSACSPILVS